MILSEFSPRKLRRKLSLDGPTEAARAAVDLLVRKRLGRPVFDFLLDKNIFCTVSSEELSHYSTTIKVHSEDPPSYFCTLIENGKIYSTSGLALTSEFCLIEESAAMPRYSRQAMMEMLSRELFYGVFPLRGLLFGEQISDSHNLDSGPVAPLIPRYPDNYYHWMVETVPKIRYLRAFEAEEQLVTLLIPADAPPFIHETLDLLGWPDSRVERAEYESYHVPELVVPSFPDRRPSDFEWLREEILESAPDHIPESGNNIYVSRANGVERRVVNEDEVMDVLSEFGFKRYLLEERSLAENARLFADADVIVGPHGAGLTDIIFAEDCTLIEIFGDKVKQPYEELSDALGVEYEPMYCQPHSVDIVVDTAKLKKKMSDLIG